MFHNQRKWLMGAAAAVGVFALAGGNAQAGNIFLTGHDILLHDGGDGYDGIILDYLRGVGTTSVTAKADYSIAFVGTSGSGYAGMGDSGNTSGNFASLGNGAAINLDGTLTGYGSATFYDAQTADWGSVLGADALVILSYTGCGGCTLTSAGSAAVNAQAAAIALAFNAGMDIWGLAGDGLASYYDFLPPGVAVTGPSIGGSNFTATAAGVALGITPAMTDGDATHNRFTGFDPSFTIFETRNPDDLSEIVSIGLQGGTITDGGIDTCGVPGAPACPAPEPGGMAGLSILGLGMAMLGISRRRRQVA